MELVILAGALAGGTTLAAAAVWAAWRYAPPSAARPKPTKDEPVEMEIVFDDEPARYQRPSHVGAPLPTRPVPTAVPTRAAPAIRAGAVVPAPPRAPTPAHAGLPAPRGHPARAPPMVLTQGVAMRDASPQRQAPARAGAPAQRPPMREPPPMKSWAQQVMESSQGEVQTEWARRQVGPVEAGRTAGACGGCGARLSVSNARPLRIACPVCGRTKLLAA